MLVTADLPAFSGKGSRIDVTVSSLGDATSLAGGTLVLTPLSGADAAIYAVAQGQVSISGFSAQGKAELLSQNTPTTGRIANGALVEREVIGKLDDEEMLILELRNPDFSTAAKIADTINAYTRKTYGKRTAREQDLRSVTLKRPDDVRAARFLAEVGELFTEPDGPARVDYRRADGNGRHRTRRPDLDGRRFARKPDGARHRERQGVAAASRSRRARRS